MSNSVRSHRRPPTRLLCPWDSPDKNTGVGYHFLLQCVKVKSLNCVQLLATAWTAAYQAPPSMRFSRQEYWSGVPLPCPSRSISWGIICVYLFRESYLGKALKQLLNYISCCFTWFSRGYNSMGKGIHGNMHKRHFPKGWGMSYVHLPDSIRHKASGIYS